MTTPPLAVDADLQDYRAGADWMLVAAAEGAVRSYCGWHIAPSTSETVVVDGSGGYTQQLPTLHLTAVSAVTEVDADGVPQTIDLVDVQWSQVGYLWRPSVWTSRLRGISVEITHGHDVVPAGVQAVVLDLAEHLANTRGGTTNDQAGPFSAQYAQQQMTPLHTMVLDAYRIPGAP